MDHLWISPSQLHPCAWAFVRVFQYWYEYQRNMESTFLNLFFHLFEVNPLSKSRGSGLVSLRRLRNDIFRVYIESWKNWKRIIYLVLPLSPLAHNEFCTVSSSSSVPPIYFDRRRWFLSSNHLSQKVKYYYVFYESLINSFSYLN